MLSAADLIPGEVASRRGEEWRGDVMRREEELSMVR